MSGSYSSRLRGGGTAGGGLAATTVLAAKVAFASAALAAAASLARMALPQLVSAADTFLWKFYLFVTIHVIIFVIWKISDNKHFHAAPHKDPWAPVPHHPAPPLLTEQVVLASMKRKVDFVPAAVVTLHEEFRMPPPVSRPHFEVAASPVDVGVVSPGSSAGESCVTTESEEEASTVAASANVTTADTWRSLEPAFAPAWKRAVVVPTFAPARARAVAERGVSLPLPVAISATVEHLYGADHDDDNNNDDDLDATWNAIMQKTRPATAPASSPSSAPAPRSSPPRPAPSPRSRAREPSVGAAELSKRSEDFINKIHHSFGREH